MVLRIVLPLYFTTAKLTVFKTDSSFLNTERFYQILYNICRSLFLRYVEYSCL